jgi:hypothetical protein
MEAIYISGQSYHDALNRKFDFQYQIKGTTFMSAPKQELCSFSERGIKFNSPRTYDKKLVLKYIHDVNRELLEGTGIVIASLVTKNVVTMKTKRRLSQ